MTLVEHLTGLRPRIFIALAAIGVGSGRWLLPRPGGDRHTQGLPRLRAPHLHVAGGAFFLQLKIALIIGRLLASPVVLYELWAFVSPGLTPRERRTLRPWIPLSIFFLVLGVGVGYSSLPLATVLPARLGNPGSLCR